MISDVKNELEGEQKKESNIKTGHLQELKKKQKKRRALKEARLIVRNLPFKANEDSIKEHFSAYGNVLEVVLLRKENKLVGCGFIQYDSKFSAAKAITNTSGREFMGRTIIVDWAIPKNKFDNSYKKEARVKEEQSIVTIKEEPTESETDEKNCTSVESDNESEKSVETEMEESIEKTVVKTPNKIKREDDTADGRTVFIKNVPFSATNDDLNECVKQFGPVYYALICKDPLTEHSKGSAFVKFKDKECADHCLNAGTSFTLNGTILDPHIALPREKVPKKEEKKPAKDNRNLYLAKEGVIIAGTPAASGVSASDMSRRLALEHSKSQKLRNLNMFVSQTRLIVHNLPPHITDKKLFKIFKEHSPSNCSPAKVKVMRNLKDVDGNGIGKSKGYGFVEFTDHRTALATLQSVNNNPNIFSKSRRPIVSFSIENSNALKVKERRALKSKMKTDKNEELETHAPCSQKTNISSQNSKSGHFAGINAIFGNKKLITKGNLKKQALLHYQEVKKQKASKRSQKSHPKLKKIQDTKSTFPRKETDDDFSRLVEKYKNKMVVASNMKKWYE